MSRPISESLTLLEETLSNCKTNLTEKEVADVDNIKISDVDEKIAEIEAGGGGFKTKVTWSQGEGNKGNFDLSSEGYINYYRSVNADSIIDIKIENCPYKYYEYLSDIDGTTVTGNLQDGSGTLTVTFNGGFGNPSNGENVTIFVLILANKGLIGEAYMLTAQYIS